MIKNHDEQFYQFSRTLSLSNDDNHSVSTCNCTFYYDTKLKAIDFSTTLANISNQHILDLLRCSKIFYKDVKNYTKHFLGIYPLQKAVVSFDDWSSETVNLTYKKQLSASAAEPPIMKMHQRKSKERSIKEVLLALKTWYQSISRKPISRRGFSLKQAAKEMGFSKKSIEDYIRIVRMGENLNFDFENYGDHKIGMLRGFIKQKIRSPMIYEITDMSQIDDYLDLSYKSYSY